MRRYGLLLTPLLPSFHLPPGQRRILPMEAGPPGPENSIHRHYVRQSKAISLLLVSFAALSCSPTSPGAEADDAIPRDLFISAYVELRLAALGAEGEEVTLQARDRVLSEMELTEKDVLDFVEVHGKDVQFMRRVWEEVDSLIEVRRYPPELEEPGDGI